MPNQTERAVVVVSVWAPFGGAQAKAVGLFSINYFRKKKKKMHDTRVPRPLEVPPTRAHRARTGRAALAAPKKNMQEGGAHFWGLDTAVSRGGGGGAHPCTPVSEGGVGVGPAEAHEHAWRDGSANDTAGSTPHHAGAAGWRLTLARRPGAASVP